MTNDDRTDNPTTTGSPIQTGGGAYIEGTVNTGGGDFIGRDKIINIFNYPPILQAPLREVFDPLIEHRTGIFGGRDAALKTVNDFINNPDGGYLVVTAPAGFGKTALMARLINAAPHAFAYHFFTDLYGADSLSERFFLQNVVEQLAQWHQHSDVLPTDLNQLRALYQHFIDAPLPQTQILILDGLDEVTTWHLAPYLSRRLPANLHLILTVRDVGQNWRDDYDLPPDQTWELPLDGLGREGVAEVLHSAGAKASVLADQAGLLDAIMTVAAYEADKALGADPFYIRLLAEDALTGKLTAANVADHPQGLGNYLDRWFDSVVALTGEASAPVDAVLDLLSTLVVTLGPISRGDLETLHPSLTKKRGLKKIFPDVINHVRRFVVGDDRQGYTLLHPRLRQHMRTHQDVAVDDYHDKLLAYCANWRQHQSPYIFAYYIDHLKQDGQATVLYDTILDEEFRTAQQAVLGNSSKTLNNLLTALALALEQDALVVALACVAAYRYTTRTTSIAQAILDAVDARDFEKAFELLAWKGHVPDWGHLFYLYVAWEAALAKETALGQKIAAAAQPLPLQQAAELSEALLVRTAIALAGDQPDTPAKLTARLASLAPAREAKALLSTFAFAEPVSEAEADALAQQIEQEVSRLEQQLAEGQAEGISAVDFLESEAEESSYHATTMRGPLQVLAAHPTGRAYIERVLKAVLNNPYPRYRDIALVSLAYVIVTVPDDAWVRSMLRHIILVGLDLEGVTFTFDLPLTLLAEAEQRNLPPAQRLDLAGYRQQALNSLDRWGTLVRAHSALAATIYRQGDRQGALDALAGLDHLPNGFAGYAVLHNLALANRWFEFGEPGDWHVATLVDLAGQHAGLVRDEAFRRDRLALVETYRAWLAQATPDVRSGLSNLEHQPDYPTRLAYIDHLSARWSWPPTAPNWPGLKALIPHALTDGTSLDALLGRLVGLYLLNQQQFPLSDADLAQAIAACNPHLMDGQPWNLSQWR